MTTKKILFPLLCGALFGLSACGDDSSSPSQPADPTNPPVDNPGVPAGNGGVTTSALPASANPAVVDAWYDSWKSYHIAYMADEQARFPGLGAEFGEVFANYAAENPARVVWSTYDDSKCRIDEAQGTAYSNYLKRGCTVSEGIGYGMLIAVFQEDFALYNSIWAYSKAFRYSAYGRDGLMPWLTFSFSWNIPDKSSATDADLDIATSLIIAFYKTGDQAYMDDAVTLMKAIWETEINPSNFLIYSGNTATWKAAADPAYNMSYFSPVALRLFAKVDPDPSHNWNAVLDAMYAYTKTVQSGGTGVFPDWSNAAGIAINPPNNSAKGTYWTFNKESVRVPWRIAWDYYWFQDPRDAEVLGILNNFIVERSAGDPAAIPPTNYSWNLEIGPDLTSATQKEPPIQWFAAWCLTGMATNIEWTSNCNALFSQKSLYNSNSSYFSDILSVMFGQLMNGKYQKPSQI